MNYLEKSPNQLFKFLLTGIILSGCIETTIEASQLGSFSSTSPIIMNLGEQEWAVSNQNGSLKVYRDFNIGKLCRNNI